MPVIPKPVMILLNQCSTISSTFENILFYEPPSGITTVSQMQAVANAAFATFAPLYASGLNQGSYFQQCRATYNDGTNEYIGYSTSSAVQGAMDTGQLPDQNAVVLRKETNLVGRANRGRWFLGGLDASIVSTTNPNEIDPGEIGVFQTLVAAMVSDQTWDALLFHARHWDRKSNSLVVIAEGAVSSRFATARARRRHQPDYAQ